MRRHKAERMAIERIKPEQLPLIRSTGRRPLPVNELVEAGAEAASSRPHSAPRVPAEPDWRAIRQQREGPSRGFGISR
jgi:hypothetical protein